MNDPAIESVAAEVYTVPTDAPEGDGTLTWDATTLVLACWRAFRGSACLSESNR
jgi:hypothetical protein